VGVLCRSAWVRAIHAEAVSASMAVDFDGGCSRDMMDKPNRLPLAVLANYYGSHDVGSRPVIVHANNIKVIDLPQDL